MEKYDIEILLGKILSGNATDEEQDKHQKLCQELPEYAKAYKQSQKLWGGAVDRISDEDIARDKAKVQGKLNRVLLSQIQKHKQKMTFYRIAAAIAIPIAIAVSVLFNLNFQSKNERSAGKTKIYAPMGHIASCQLPDGTMVWINSGATVSYDVSDFKSDERSVQLEGEAYFQVPKNQKVPFFVRTEIANVKVTGTSFNVKTDTESKIFETVLNDGIVLLRSNNRGTKEIKLNPGERAVYRIDRKQFEIQNVDAEMYSSWRNGEIIFRDATLKDLMLKLEQIYGIQVIFEDPEMANYRFRGMFSYNSNLIDALEKIKSTARIDYYIKNKKVWLKNETKKE